MLTRPRTEGGFTLIEVLGAAVIMAVGLLALVNVMNFAHRMQVRAIANSMEWTIFQAKLDEIVGAPFTAFDASCNPITPGTACNGYTHPSIGDLLTQTYPDDDYGYGDWTYTITVTNLAPGGNGTPVQTGDGTIIRRVDVALSKSGSTGLDFEDTFSLVVLDKDDLVP